MSNLLILLLWIPIESDFQKVLERVRREPEMALKELVFQAEVYGETKRSTALLNELLGAVDRGNKDLRTRIIHALAVVKAPGTEADRRSVPAVRFADPSAVYLSVGHRYLLIEGQWFGLGDWTESGYLAELDEAKVVFAQMDGTRSETAFNLSQTVGVNNDNRATLLVNGANVGEIIRFVAALDNLNWFAPARLEIKIEGVYRFRDSLDFIDQICDKYELAWFRQRDNIGIRYAQKPSERWVIDRYDKENASLFDFLDMIARRSGMELDLEDALYETTLDIYLENEPWDEAMECVAMSNDLNWSVYKESNPPTLIIRKK